MEIIVRKLFSSLSLAIVAAAGMLAGTAPSFANAGGLRLEYDYPNAAISDSNRPIFADDYAWFKSGGTDVGTLAGADKDGVRLIADGRADTLHDLDGDGGPIAHDDRAEAGMRQPQSASNADDMMYSAEEGEYGDGDTLHDLEDGGGPKADNGMYP